MVCSKCGKEIDETLNFCPNCGNNLKEQVEENKIDDVPESKEEVKENNPLKGSYEITNNNNSEISEEDLLKIKETEMANNLCVVSLLLYFLGGFVFGFIPGLGKILGMLSPLAAIGIMVYVRIKYPQNIFGKVLMIVYIVLTILAIIGLILLVIMCRQLANSCQGMY